MLLLLKSQKRYLLLRKGAPMGNQNAKKNGGNDNSGKPHMSAQPLTKEQLNVFVHESLANSNAAYKRAIIGKITEAANKRIEAAYGEKVKLKDIDIDNNSIHHAVTKLDHNLEPEDLILAVDVINTSTDIKLSNEKHQDNDVLIFKKDIDGEITFLTEVRIKNRYLLVCDAWRQKKARSRKRSDAAGGSPKLTSKTSFPRNELISTVSTKPGKKSRGSVNG